MLQRSSVYRRRDTYYVHSSSKTDAGVWILSEPIMATAASAGDEALGTSVLATLDASQTGVPHPRVFNRIFDPVLALAGVKSWSTFVNGAQLVDVERERDAIVVVPNKNLGAAEGFIPETSLRIKVPTMDIRELGRVIREVLARAV